MKKLIVFTMIAAAFSSAATAQTKTAATTGTKFSIGPSVGYGWTTVGNIDKSKFKAAANFGLASVYSAAEHFGIGVDVKYSIEGAKWDAGNGNTNELDLHYVRIPIKAIFFLKDYGSRGRPKLFVGPSLGFLSSAKLNTTNGSSDIKSEFDSFDLGIHVGGGFNYRLVNRTWLNVDLAYTQGTKDIIHQNSTIRTIPAALNPIAVKNAGDKFLNRNVTLNVGVLFGL